MADVNISKFRASVVRDGSKPASPGFVVSEGQSPTDPAGSGQNHLPVTIAAAATGLAITESQILSGAGTVGQYIRGDGSLADFPSASGGGSSVSYYLNGSVAQGTIGGVAYKELSKVPVLGTGTDFTINADGYIASFLTDAGDPNLLEIPGGNWNFETYFSASSSGGTPTFYVELYKYDGSTFTLLASNSGAPEFIAFGTTLTSYFSTLAVPATALALTDRLAIRYYVNHSGRTITMHTENNHLCQVITTFTTGLTALNGLTAQVQNFAVGTSGSDFNIVSASATHTFNLPTATATMRGALSSADWSTFNAKQNALTLTTTGTSGAATLVGSTLNIPNYSPDLSGYVPTSRTITINGTTQDLSANRTFNVGTVTSVGLSSATSGVTIGSTPVTSSGTITLAIATASGSQQGLLSASDWTTFNNKQNALTNPVTGTGTTNYLAKFTGGTTIGNSALYDGGGFGGFNSTGLGSRTFVINAASGRPLALELIENANVHAIYFRPNNSGYNLISSNYISGGVYLPLSLSARENNADLVLATSGNLLVGTTSDNGARLQVSGTATISNRLLVGTTSGVGQDFVSVRFSSADTFSQGLNMVDSNASANGGTFQVFRRSDDTYLGNIRRNGTDNAIYVGGNSYLSLGANNTEFARITSSGNVGIGTSSPSSKLEIVGDAEMLNLRNSTTSTITGRIGVRTDGAMQIYSFQSGVSYKPVIFGVDGGFLSAGNVLIGTTTDGGARLQIVSTGVALNMATSNGQMANINSTNANGGYITWQTSGTTIADLGTAQQIFGSGGNDTFGINGRGARALTFGTNDVERFRISSTGFVSAGATTNGRLGVRGFTNDSSGYAFEAANASGNTLFIVRNDGISTFSSNVGIGTFSPSAPLHIVTPTGVNFQNAIRFEKAGGYGEVNLENYYTTGSNYGFGIDVAGTTMMVVNNSGNVGIGTTTPINGGGNSKWITLDGNSYGGGFISSVGGTAKGYLYFDDGTATFAMQAASSVGVSFLTSNTERARITSGGNVLIGTTTDGGQRLQVSGSIYLLTGGNRNIRIGSATNYYYDLQSTNDDFQIIEAGSTPRLTIKYPNGNVGIGTTSPATRLMVQDSANTYVAHFSGLNQANGIAIGTNSSNVAVIQGYTRTFSATNNIAMQVDGGNVGIGTSSPSSPLQVRGQSSVPQNGIFLSTNTFTLLSTGSLLRLGHIAASGDTTAIIENLTQGGQAAGNIAFPTGNVLIGTTTDNGAKLNVNGTIRTANPTGSTSDGWLLGRALVSGTSTPDRWIRVQIGNLYYDILAVYMGSV